MNDPIEVSGLYKNFGKVKAVDGIGFTVREGEIFGMLGPNGAGKTTTIECTIGLKKPAAGRVRVLDMEPRAERRRLFSSIGVQLQETSYPERIRVDEICGMFGCFYKNPLPYRGLLERFGLSEKIHTEVSKLSGGLRQKLSIALAMIPNPRVLFLDELTTGLDPHARRSMWDLIKELRKEGRTIFMTTHYMEEAEFLCDRLCFVQNGRIVEMDTVPNILNKSGIDHVIMFEAPWADIARLNNIEGVNRVDHENGRFILQGKGRRLLANVVNFLENDSIDYVELNFKRPNLEDVFLKLTGSRL